MKISCDVIMDLLPLYYDGICSDNSKRIVEEHLNECDSCKIVLEKIKDDTLDKRLKKEYDGVVSHHTKAVKRKTYVAGVSIAAIMAIPVFVCLIVNLATGHALDWFFIVLTSLMTLASLTVVPLIFEKKKLLMTLGSFAGSLILLLFTCSLYTGGDWFFVATVSILFGLTILFAPYVLSQLPLGGFASRNKGILAMTANTVLLFAVIFVSGLYIDGGVEYYSRSIQVTLLLLLLPWGLFLIIRYVKLNAPVRAGLSTLFCGLFLSYGLSLLDRILVGPIPNRMNGANLLMWNDATINSNVFLLVFVAGCVIGGLLLIAGLLWGLRKQ